MMVQLGQQKLLYHQQEIEMEVCGTQTTAISVGGRDPTAPPYLNTVDTYDGTSWTNVTNYPTGLHRYWNFRR
jgi:hypothetical protein